MSKKFVRGITDIKTISNQDFDTNNVNDLLSDGQNCYIHRKKGNTEEYHNLTNNIKTIQSDDTDLVSVTNYNNTTNSATIRPKHDAQKEQVLESTDETILISHGENGTDETTNVDVNPDKIRTLVAPSVTTYSHQNATLKLFKRPTGDGNLEFKFFVCLKKGATTAEFVMSQQDLDYFYYIITTYGQDGRINVQGSSFEMFEHATRVYFNSNGSTFNPHFINFFDIIPINVATNTQQSAPSRVEKGDIGTVDKVVSEV